MRIVQHPLFYGLATGFYISTVSTVGMSKPSGPRRSRRHKLREGRNEGKFIAEVEKLLQSEQIVKNGALVQAGRNMLGTENAKKKLLSYHGRGEPKFARQGGRQQRNGRA
eukprot:GHVT01023263.1.p1 GENE.GHVT01023263.1~~GHVT01023263.1.p1  ORF type:complete len:110 (+),score=11.67 GHVT01023263.1:827-1156(+)